MATWKWRTFTTEPEADAVKRCASGGRAIGQVAQDLDLAETAASTATIVRAKNS